MANEASAGFSISIFIIIIEGFILAGFINLAHECIHGHFYKNKKVTSFVGGIAAAIHLISFHRYKDDHFAHHRHVGSAGDTEDNSSFETIGQYFMAMLSMGFLRKGICKIYEEYCLARRSGYLIRFMQRNGMPLAFALFVAAFLMFYPEVVLRNYMAPIVLANAWIFVLGLPEHYDCALNKNWKENARSTKSNLIVRFFQWGANWHAHHHRFPGTPSPYLAKKHPELQLVLKHQEWSYVLWHLRLIRRLISQ